jgi:hypothetical protein
MGAYPLRQMCAMWRSLFCMCWRQSPGWPVPVAPVPWCGRIRARQAPAADPESFATNSQVMAKVKNESKMKEFAIIGAKMRVGRRDETGSGRSRRWERTQEAKDVGGGQETDLRGPEGLDGRSRRPRTRSRSTKGNGVRPHSVGVAQCVRVGLPTARPELLKPPLGRTGGDGMLAKCRLMSASGWLQITAALLSPWCIVSVSLSLGACKEETPH